MKKRLTAIMLVLIALFSLSSAVYAEPGSGGGHPQYYQPAS